VAMAFVYVAVGPEARPGDETNEADPVLRVLLLHGWLRTSPSSIDQLRGDGAVKCLNLTDEVYCYCDGDGKHKMLAWSKLKKLVSGRRSNDEGAGMYASCGPLGLLKIESKTHGSETAGKDDHVIFSPACLDGLLVDADLFASSVSSGGSRIIIKMGFLLPLDSFSFFSQCIHV